MKVFRFFVPASETGSLRNLIGTRLFSILLATLALSGATLNTARDLHSSIDDATASRVESSMPLGLSRERSDFNKAIEMLADAAPANRHLADYYQGVTKRVKGDSADGENTSGIDVVKSGMSLPFTVGDMAFDTNPAIDRWMNYYAATPVGRRTMTIGIVRSNAYLEMARAEFRKAGVPEDLVWLALVESVWNPQAVSPAAAGGIWQFIPSTAIDYGLTVQSGNDERADPLKQTRVAAAYLHDLYAIFGDWALAMAAYNSGEPRVMSAIVKNGRADFWDLHDKQLLPKETCNYVPKILAAIKIASQAELYGLAPQAETDASAGS